MKLRSGKTPTRRSNTLRPRPDLIVVVLGVVVLGVVVVDVVVAGSVARAQQQSQAESTASALERFAEAWNDEGWGPKRSRRQPYMRSLDDAGWKQRMLVLQQSVRQGEKDSAELVKALSHDSAAVRALAVQALGYANDASARPALAKAVERDVDAVVRLYAADSIGMLGGEDDGELLKKRQPAERNRDTKRHIGYALDRRGNKLEASVSQSLRDWDPKQLATARLGKAAPDFSLTSIDGKRVQLRDYRGKKSVVLIFVYGDT